MLPNSELTLKQLAAALVSAHAVEDLETIKALWFPDPQQRVLRLIEITRSVSPGDQVIPFGYTLKEGSARGQQLELILLHPSEWDKVQSGMLQLPHAWGSHQDAHIVWTSAAPRA